jgi:Mn2+/Fe2+ NRAMP family transporter
MNEPSGSGQHSTSSLLRSIEGKPFPRRIAAYVRLTGPGWMQSALTLGGGSLAGSLYLGTLTGYGMLWLQPLAMLLGMFMMAAIGYVTLSTGERPFAAVRDRVNPFLGWSWAIASLLASMVWALPQYSLANGVIQQNLLPSLLGPHSALGERGSTLVICGSILLFATLITWNYARGSLGVRIYDLTLKVMVAVIVAAFFGVVLRLMLVPPAIDVGALLRGFIPDPTLLLRPADAFVPLLDAIPPEARAYWTHLIVDRQQEVMAAAFSTAVGINMTFLFGYSLLTRRWGPEFRGFMIFDLATGMLIPFVLATTCITVAAGSQFYGVPVPGLAGARSADVAVQPPARQVSEYRRLLTDRLALDAGPASVLDPAEIDRRVAGMDPDERTLAALLVTRDASDLASAIRPIAGDFISRVVFGIGVLGMALSTITLMMLICGLVVCEVLGRPQNGWTFRLGSLLGASGALGPFFWSKASFWLAVPTSVIALMLLPIAYVTFLVMMNRRRLLGASMPAGWQRVGWNTLMGTAVTVVSAASLFMIVKQTGAWGVSLLALLLVGVGVAELRARDRARPEEPALAPVREAALESGSVLEKL